MTSTSRTARCETRTPGGVAGVAGVTRPPYADLAWGDPVKI